MFHFMRWSKLTAKQATYIPDTPTRYQIKGCDGREVDITAEHRCQCTFAVHCFPLFEHKRQIWLPFELVYLDYKVD